MSAEDTPETTSGGAYPSPRVENAPERASDGAETLASEIADALEDLTPKQTQAVRHYTDPGSDGFGNQNKAVELAGYSAGTAGSDVFRSERVRAAVRVIEQAQVRHGADLMDQLKALAPAAKDEIQSQLRLGKNLEAIDPRHIFGDDVEIEGDVQEARLREIVKHNRVIAKLAKERRAAAELILAYAEGTPEQRMRVTREASTSDVEEWLADMSREEFEELGEALGIRPKEKAPPAEADEAIEADYEVLDEADHEQEDASPQ